MTNTFSFFNFDINVDHSVSNEFRFQNDRSSHQRCSIKKVVVNPLSVNCTKRSNTLKQFVGKLQTNCLSVFDHFAGLALKGLII